MPTRIIPALSMETLKPIRAWTDILQTLRGYRCQPRLLYLTKLSIIIDGENKIFHDEVKFKECLPTDPALQKILIRKF